MLGEASPALRYLVPFHKAPGATSEAHSAGGEPEVSRKWVSCLREHYNTCCQATGRVLTAGSQDYLMATQEIAIITCFSNEGPQG